MNISICFHNSHGLLLVPRLEVLRAVQQPVSLWDTFVTVISHRSCRSLASCPRVEDIMQQMTGASRKSQSGNISALQTLDSKKVPVLAWVCVTPRSLLEQRQIRDEDSRLLAPTI